MKLQTLALAAVLGLAMVSFVSAKSYDVQLDGPSLAGSVQVPAGEYHLKVNGDQAVFTDVNNGSKTFTAQVKQETSAQKYDETAIVTTNTGNGTNRIDSIQLGGSKLKLEFK